MLKIEFSTLNPLLRYSTEHGVWTVEEMIIVGWNGHVIQVPKGFKTDLASIPSRLRSVVSQVGKHIVPAIVHDWCYLEHPFTKEDADDMFLEGMKFTGVPWYRRWTMYIAVYIGGASSWNR